MTDNVTNQLLLEHLKAIQGRLSNIEEETRIMRTEIAGMSQNIAAHSLRLDESIKMWGVFLKTGIRC